MKKLLNLVEVPLQVQSSSRRSVKSSMQMIAVYMLFLLLREKDLMEILR